MTELLGYITTRKWMMILIVVLILLVPYKATWNYRNYPFIDSDAFLAQSIGYRLYYHRSNLGQIHRSISIPFISRDFLFLGFYYNNYYQPHLQFIVWRAGEINYEWRSQFTH